MIISFPRIKKEVKVAIQNPVVFSRRIKRFTFSKFRSFFESYLNGYAFLPNTVLLALTYRCNLRCRMCNQYGDDFKKASQKELDKREWLEVAKRILKIKPLKIVISGGEPFLHNACIELIYFFKKHNIFVSIITNGSFLDKFADALVDSGIDIISISLDGPEKVHNNIRNSSHSYTDIIRGIQTLNYKKEVYKKTIPEISINAVITHWNQDYLIDMIEIVKPLKIKYISFQHLMFHSKEIGDRHRNFILKNFGDDAQKMYMEYGLNYPHNIDTYRLKQQIKQILSFKNESFYINFIPQGINENLGEYYNNLNNPLFSKCTYPWSNVKINYKGDVSLCLQYTLGNILEQPLEQMWNNSKAVRFRQTLLRLERKRELFPACTRCCLRSFGSK